MANQVPANNPDKSPDKNHQRKLIAVLRHVTPDEVTGVGDILVEAGITMIEVTANSRDYEESLSRIVGRYPEAVWIGAGTVITAEELERVHRVGVSFIVSPHTDPLLIAKTKSLGLLSFPGVFTPTEAFTALKAGADVLKLFPASWCPPNGARDLKAVLPPGTVIYALGGVAPKNFSQFLQGGYDGFGLGNSLYRPGIKPDEVKKNSREIVLAYDQAVGNLS